MQRWTTVVIGALLVAVLGALVWKQGQGAPSSAAGDAGHLSIAAQPSAAIDAGTLDDPTLANLREQDAGAVLPLGLVDTLDHDPGIGLPTGSPKNVHFGVILVQYRGAQGAPASARSKGEAASLSHELANAAKADFRAQVAKGDPGSMDDAGRIPRGVLEPAAEFALFSLPAGGVSEPIDTPRGFWIVRRIE